MPDDPRSHGLWGVSAPPAPPTVPLAGALGADVIVVGTGFTGCSAALHLARAGVSVIVIEAAEIGHGGSGRNVGLVNAGLWVMPDALAAALPGGRGERLLDQLSAAPRLVFDLIAEHAIACEAVRAGTLHCAASARGFAEITERARQWRARGADVTLLDAAETRRRVGSAAYAGSLLDRRAGTIQPLAYVRGLAAAAIAHGARVFTRAPVRSWSEEGGRWTVRTADGEAVAPWLLVATDGYGRGAGEALRAEQVALPYFNFATAPLDARTRAAVLPGGEGAWDTRRVLSSFRLDQRGRLVFGSVGALRGTGASIHRDWARRALDALFPALRGIAFEHGWYGHIGMTADALPRLHRLGPRAYSIGGYNGRGIAPGTSFGRDLARLALGETRPEDLALPLTECRPARLRTVRSLGYETGAQLAHLAGARL